MPDVNPVRVEENTDWFERYCKSTSRCASPQLSSNGYDIFKKIPAELKLTAMAVYQTICDTTCICDDVDLHLALTVIDPMLTAVTPQGHCGCDVHF